MEKSEAVRLYQAGSKTIVKRSEFQQEASWAMKKSEAVRLYQAWSKTIVKRSEFQQEAS